MTEKEICSQLPIKGVPNNAKQNKITHRMAVALAIMTWHSGNDILDMLQDRVRGKAPGNGIAIPLDSGSYMEFEDFKEDVIKGFGIATSANDDLDKIIAIAIAKNASVSMNHGGLYDWGDERWCNASLLVNVSKVFTTMAELFAADKSFLTTPMSSSVKLTSTWTSSGRSILAYKEEEPLEVYLNRGIYGIAYYLLNDSINSTITDVRDNGKFSREHPLKYPLGVDENNEPVELLSYLKANYNYEDVKNITPDKMWDFFTKDTRLKKIVTE